MKADALFNWEKTELANLLAETLADAEELIEALPAIKNVGAWEERALDVYIKNEWGLILSHFEIDEIDEWLKEKDYEEAWECWENECIENDHEYADYKNEEYCWSLIEFYGLFRDGNLDEQGFGAKQKMT